MQAGEEKAKSKTLFKNAQKELQVRDILKKNLKKERGKNHKHHTPAGTGLQMLKIHCVPSTGWKPQGNERASMTPGRGVRVATK